MRSGWKRRYFDKWIIRIFRLPRVADIERALRDELHKGMEIGQKPLPPIFGGHPVYVEVSRQDASVRFLTSPPQEVPLRYAPGVVWNSYRELPTRDRMPAYIAQHGKPPVRPLRPRQTAPLAKVAAYESIRTIALHEPVLTPEQRARIAGETPHEHPIVVEPMEATPDEDWLNSVQSVDEDDNSPTESVKALRPTEQVELLARGALKREV